MKKQTITKIISVLIIFVFVVSIFQSAIPVQAANGISNLYANPNQNTKSNNTYKFKVSDVVNSNLLTSIVGCTGVVNKVAGWMAKFIQSPVKQAKLLAQKIGLIKDQISTACTSTKAGAEAAADSAPTMPGFSKTVSDIFSKIKAKIPGLGKSVSICQDKVMSIDDSVYQELMDQAEAENAKTLKEQCFDGIAVTLAKNQLTAMTRSAMNWVNSGYGGNPFFVQNMQNLTNNIEKNVIETGIDAMLAPDNVSPYATDFAKAKIMSSKNILQGTAGFFGGLQSDLSAFITDPQSYYSDATLKQAATTQTVLERAREANSRFENDFSVGGWDGYMALTQRDQNNPLGFNMTASQYFSDTQTQQVATQKEEITQNNGFLNQKTCTMWQWYDNTGKPLVGTAISAKSAAAGLQAMSTNSVIKPNKSTTSPNFDKCVEWKTITPGSIVKDKVTNYLDSPERQLELAKTINDSLNALFSVLISKLEGGGLAGLSDSATATSTDWNDTLNSFASPSIDGSTPYDNNGAYDGFNLTRDLGNTYIHDDAFNAGTWNANSEVNLTDKGEAMTLGYVPPVYKKVRIWDDATNDWKYDETTKDYIYDNQLVSSNLYWTVTTKGSTKLIDGGFNGWEVGDRAFWDGSNWQNWKKGQPSPIKNRGVIQIQQDYIIAAKEILGVLPNVMTKLGELDYCLPGPNPSYKTNSTDAQSGYQDLIGSMRVGPGLYNRQYRSMDDAGSRTFEIFNKIFSDIPYMWDKILKTQLLNQLYNGAEPWGGSHTVGNHGDYTNQNNYEPQKTELANRFLDATSDYVNNALFTNFYEIFDNLMDSHYFKKMTSKYIEHEDRAIILPTTDASGNITNSGDLNPAYIPMAQTGLDLVKNISTYDDDISKAKQDYIDSMTQAKVNISKLEEIKTEVSKIILAAQARRDARLVDILKKESTDNGTPILTAAQYKTKYAACLDEENIQVYDADTITNMNLDTERCFNGIDDDLNGLVDSKDPACNKKTSVAPTPTPPVYRCVTGASTTNETQNPQNTVCSARKTESECSNDFYYHGALANVCSWITGPAPQINPYSLYGCRIDESVISKPQSNPENQHCFQRTQTECTATKYIDANGMGYSCKFTLL